MTDIAFIVWILMGVLIAAWGVQRWMRKRKEK
jgi:hypothetical protein